MWVYYHIVWWRAAKISSPWEPQLLVLPGALWHDRWADCKHRTSTSGIVPSQWLYKPLHLDRLFTWITSKVQATSPNVCKCPMYMFVRVYTPGACSKTVLCAARSSLGHGQIKNTLLGFTQVNYLVNCDSVNLLLGTSLWPCMVVKFGKYTASWHIQYFLFVVPNIFS